MIIEEINRRFIIFARNKTHNEDQVSDFFREL